MNLLSLIIGVIFFSLLVGAALWIGLYVVLPLALLFVFVSVMAALPRSFMPARSNRHVVSHSKSHQNQIIDVEFEEIK